MNKYWYEWTESAVDCYERGCICRDCAVQEIIGNECKMKYAVMSLVRQFGKPKVEGGNFLPFITPRLQKVVDAILAGANTKAEIAEKLGIKTSNVQERVNKLYTMVEAKGYRFQKR